MYAAPSPPLTNKDELVRFLEAGCKPAAAWRVGTEHEKMGFYWDSLRPLPYAGGIRAILDGLATRFGWSPVLEGNLPIALTLGAASISLEPGGQLELSGAPLATIHETRAEIDSHLEQLAAVCHELGVAFVGVGAQPKWPLAEMPWMPKGRYRVMRDYLPTRGALGLDMMTRTATVQANLDFASEADMVRKFRLAMALQPLATALFANSPFLDGRPTGYLSTRAHIWQQTDPDRCGWLPFLFEGEMGFEKYVDYALDVPMLFFYQEGRYTPADGTPFRLFLEGRHPRRPGRHPTLADWELHLTTLFPDVRLKRYLEMRGADAGDSAALCALPALWKGLLYDGEALAAAWQRVQGWSPAQRAALWGAVPRQGLATPIPGGGTLQTLAQEVLALAEAGLERLACRNPAGASEALYLQPLHGIAASGQAPAEALLAAYRGRWGQSVDPLFHEERFESFIARCHPGGHCG